MDRNLKKTEESGVETFPPGEKEDPYRTETDIGHPGEKNKDEGSQQSNHPLYLMIANFLAYFIVETK